MSEELRTIHVTVKADVAEREVERIRAYLWDGWQVVSLNAHPKPDERFSTVVINGHDNAGWTAQAQADRLWSGLLAAEVVR